MGSLSRLKVSVSTQNCVWGRAFWIAFLTALNHSGSCVLLACSTPTPSCNASTSIGLRFRTYSHMVCHWEGERSAFALKKGEITIGLPGVSLWRWLPTVR